MEASKLGLYFDEFVIGETVEHALSKTIFESDNNFFSLLTMNHHPVHTNLDYARKNQHGQLLVVGTLVFSLVVGMTVPDISGKAIANLGTRRSNIWGQCSSTTRCMRERPFSASGNRNRNPTGE